ncbi:Eukaryotic translation initiation factor 3 subunit H [Sesamum alatum]|uniref:Eukaryotic translation initiation factor 3 subunit H n=1 Tax=Sesamum alatum TaxID=300844 RepID=A0AAE2CDV3_9LAMI|nr:Eukaryotic translation initiation factor 3 subunit H [Sesamum alatum]
MDPSSVNCQLRYPLIQLHSSSPFCSLFLFLSASFMANTATRSFLQVAATEEATTPLRVVQIEGLVILKIIKHCKEFSPALVTGLLGLDVGSVLEVIIVSHSRFVRKMKRLKRKVLITSLK